MSQFQVGDKVRIIANPPKNKSEGPNWISDMGVYCGKEAFVHSLNSSGDCRLRNEKGHVLPFLWMQKWLEPFKPLPVRAPNGPVSSVLWKMANDEQRCHYSLSVVFKEDSHFYLAAGFVSMVARHRMHGGSKANSQVQGDLALAACLAEDAGH